MTVYVSSYFVPDKDPVAFIEMVQKVIEKIE